MTKRLYKHRGLSLLALAVIATASSGCRSSNFSMPTMKMFSWNRQPDAATLAGNTQPAGLPESPAAKYDPAALASATNKSSSSGSTSSVGSAYGYGATGSGTGATPGTATQPGLAAAANGYQTGPYQLAPKNGTPSATTVASTATAGNMPSGSLPSPYGGTYSSTTAGLGTNNSTAAAKTDVPLPSSVTAALGQTAATSGAAIGGLPSLPGAAATNIPALPAGYTSAGTGQVPASTSAYQMMPTPPGYPTNNPYATGKAPGSPTGLPGGASTTAATPGSTTAAAGNVAGLPAIPASPTGTAGASANPAAAASSAYQGAAPAATGVTATTPGIYSPGSTGRTTSYDFSGGTQKNAASSGTTSTTSGTQPLLR